MSAPQKAQMTTSTAIRDLWQTAKAGDIEGLRQALAAGADVNARNNVGLTPLMMAAYHGRTEMVAALVEQGADPNVVDRGGVTAARLAEDAGHEETLTALVDLGVERKPSRPSPRVVSMNVIEEDV